MLEELDIKNFALIDSAHVEFKKGFTVLSGETGAGKSILIGSLAFLLGGKAGVEQIRNGCHEASVWASFLLESKESFSWLEEHGIETEDGRILLRRLIRDTGKSSSWIGGVAVTRNDLLDFASFLVDIHGQHEQQSLMKVGEHRRYLDIYAGITDEVESFKSLYTELVEKRRILDGMKSNQAETERKIEMLKFALDEIEGAKLKNGEDEELEEEERRLSSFEKLCSDLEAMNSILGGSEDGDSVLSMLKKLTSLSSSASSMDKKLSDAENRIQSVYYEVEDLSKEIQSYSSSLVFDPERLEAVQDRLEVIYKLKKKYASSSSPLSDVISYGEKARKELEKLDASSLDRGTLEEEISSLEKTVYEKARKISAERKSASDKMSAEIEAILSKLGMKGTRFSVSLREKEGNRLEQKCGPYGMDDIEFLIAANAGSSLLPLSRIASGGELSRVMLAMKTILAEGDTVSTLVFDEIDTGIGGEVAVALGEHMKALANSKQILCITHLASIACFADNQIKIKKGLEGNATSTHVSPVTGEERVQEIARMLSGDADSAESLSHASALLKKYGNLA